MNEPDATAEADRLPFGLGPASGEGAGLLFEIDIAAMPADVSGPLRDWGRSLSSSLRAFFEIQGDAPRFTAPLDVAVAALERDARRLEAFASRVAAGADERDALAEVIRGGGFLLRRLIHELEQGRREAAGGAD